MGKEGFLKIMEECGHTTEVSEWAWERRPVDKPDGKTVRLFAQALKELFTEFNLF